MIYLESDIMVFNDREYTLSALKKQLLASELHIRDNSYKNCSCIFLKHMPTISELASEGVGFTKDPAEKEFMKRTRDQAEVYAEAIGKPDFTEAKADEIREWARDTRRRIDFQKYEGDIPKTAAKDEECSTCKPLFAQSNRLKVADVQEEPNRDDAYWEGLQNWLVTQSEDIQDSPGGEVQTDLYDAYLAEKSKKNGKKSKSFEPAEEPFEMYGTAKIPPKVQQGMDIFNSLNRKQIGDLEFRYHNETDRDFQEDKETDTLYEWLADNPGETHTSPSKVTPENVKKWADKRLQSRAKLLSELQHVKATDLTKATGEEKAALMADIEGREKEINMLFDELHERGYSWEGTGERGGQKFHKADKASIAKPAIEVVVDMGKPYSETFATMQEAEKYLTNFYHEQIEGKEDEIFQLDINILENGEDISERQDVQEMFANIIEPTEEDALSTKPSMHQKYKSGDIVQVEEEGGKFSHGKILEDNGNRVLVEFEMPGYKINPTQTISKEYVKRITKQPRSKPSAASAASAPTEPPRLLKKAGRLSKLQKRLMQPRAAFDKFRQE